MTRDRKIAWVFLFVMSLVVGGTVSVSLGQDANWDLKNYHLYNPWAYLDHRLHRDLLTAGIQTYFSPFLDVPYYVLSVDWLPRSPALLAFIMGLPFGLLIFASFVVSWIVSEHYQLSFWLRVVLCSGTSLFGLTGVPVISQVGSTMNEVPIASIVVLALVFLLMNARERPSGRRTDFCFAGAAGLLLGLAAALKLTAVTYAPGGAIICWLCPGCLRQKLMRSAAFVVAWWVAFLLVWGPWGIEVYHLTGSPMFPLFNNFFHSRLIAPEALRDLHAMPSGPMQALFYPFDWIAPNSTVMEWQFADPRYAIAYVCLVAVAVAAVLRLCLPSRTGAPTRLRLPRASLLVIIFVIVSYVAWEALFSILRYTVAIESLLGVIVFIAFSFVLSSVPVSRLRRMIGVASVVLLGALLFFSQYPNLGRVAFGKTVYAVHIPPIESDATVVFADSPTAFLAPFMAKRRPDIAFIGSPTYFVLDPRLAKSLLEQWMRDRLDHANHIYVVYYQSSIPPEATFRTFGLQVDYTSCRAIDSNIATTITLCRATSVRSSAGAKSTLFHLVAVAHAANQLSASFTFGNGCTLSDLPTTARITVSPMDAADGMTLVVQSPPGRPVPFADVPATGSVTTQKWIGAGQIISFRDRSGQIRARYDLQYVECP